MPVVACSACERKHVRPINSKCLYFKRSVQVCEELGISTDEWRFHLPELGTLDPVIDPTLPNTGGDKSHSPKTPGLVISDKDILAVIRDNESCRQKVNDAESKIAFLTQQVSELSFLISSRQSETQSVPGAVGGIFPPPISHASLPVTTTAASTAATTTWSTSGAGASSGLMQWSALPSSFPHHPGMQTQPAFGVPPPPGLMSTSTSTSVFGAPQQGYRSWLYNVSGGQAARPPSGLHYTSPGFSTFPSTPGIPGSSISGVPISTVPTFTNATSLSGNANVMSSPLSGIPHAASVSAPTLSGIPQSTVLMDPSGGPPVTVMIDSSGIKAATKKRKCVLFDIEPHLYVENIKSASIEDVISADMSLFESMLSLGFPVGNFSKHIRFLSDKSKVFTSVALVKYDLACREKAELLGPNSFVYGDHELYHTFLGVENLKPKPRGSTSPKSKNKRVKGLCWRFNDSRGCKKESCPYKHECRDCSSLTHGFPDCKVKK